MSNNVEFYRLETITDTHVGTGESGFGFIDQLIQRDSATGYPCFNSTSMKGAIKQHVDNYSSADNKNELMTLIFGSDASANKGGIPTITQQGESVFFTAHLLAMPVRTNKVSYLLTTSPELINSFEYMSKLLGKPISKSIYEEVKTLVSDSTPESGICFNNNYSGAELDIVGTTLQYNSANNELAELLNTLFDTINSRIALVSDRTMAELCSDLYLPVISRNALDDGESQNLWYEQVLPRFSLMYFANIWKNMEQQKFVEETHCGDNKRPLQVGGNASVSYGFTSISKF